jgi:hypothetical protein
MRDWVVAVAAAAEECGLVAAAVAALVAVVARVHMCGNGKRVFSWRWWW